MKTTTTPKPERLAEYHDAGRHHERMPFGAVVVAALVRARGRVALVDAQSGDQRGKLPLRGGKFDRVRVGSILKVVSARLTSRGILREARPDTDAPGSWLVKF